MNSDLRVKEIEINFEPCTARTPLKFGAVVMDQVTFCRIRATVENRAGAVADGWGGIFLADFWSWPTPELPHDAKEACMKHVVQRVADQVLAYPHFAHPVDLFWELEPELDALNQETCALLDERLRQPLLGALVCASPIDAAIHDAFGNVNGIDSYRGYGPEFMGDLSRYLGPRYRGKYVSQYLRDAYLPEVPVFHLVGGLDKLTAAEKDDSDPRAWTSGSPATGSFASRSSCAAPTWTGTPSAPWPSSASGKRSWPSAARRSCTSPPTPTSSATAPTIWWRCAAGSRPPRRNVSTGSSTSSSPPTGTWRPIRTTCASCRGSSR